MVEILECLRVGGNAPLKTISDFDSISARDICLDGIGIIHQPRLEEIRDMGFDKYRNCLAFISIDMDSLMKVLKISEEKIPEGLVPFDIFSIDAKAMEILLSALQPFFVSKLEFSEKHKAIVSVSVGSNNSFLGKIDRENFPLVRNVIMEISGLEIKDDFNAKPKNEKAKKIMEQLAKGRAKLAASKRNKKEEERNSLWNIIGAVAACSSTYNLTNIWQLTVLQLYDQFARINNRFYLDIMATRWCAWGEDKFDHDPWYSVPEK